MKIDEQAYLLHLKERLLHKDNWQQIQFTKEWRSRFSASAGVYAVKDCDQVVYVGESGSLKGRMKDLFDSRHHTIRRTIGEKHFSMTKGFSPATSDVKFPPHIETLVNDHICHKLSIAYIEVVLGRKELEEMIESEIDRNVRLNKKGKRKLNNDLMEPTKHPIWEVFLDAGTLESFKENFVPPFFIKNEIPEVVKNAATISEKLLLHSYYEYDFIDVALTNAIFAFEKALKIRWTDIHNAKPTNLSFYQLIDWFSKNNYFETRNDTLPQQLRLIRNGKVHDEKDSKGGAVFIRKVYETFDLINDLYEAPQLRISRKQLTYDLTDQLSKFTKQGAILTWGEKRLIMFELYPVFINNKTQPNSLLLLVCPIFDLSKYELGEHFDPPYSIVTVNEWKFTEDGFEGKDTRSGETVILSAIQDEINLIKFQEWNSRFYKLPSWSLISFTTTEPMNDLFIKALRDFHSL